MPAAPRSPTPDPDLLELTVQCLHELERAGPPGVAALLAGHPEEAPSLIARLMILGDLGLLPEVGATPGADARPDSRAGTPRAAPPDPGTV